MRMQQLLVVGSLLVVAACGKSAEEKGLEAAKAEEMKELADKKAKGEIAPTKRPPIANNARVPCEQLINPEAFTTALEEKEPLTVRDETAKDGDAAASCALVKGGKKLTAAEQEALRKKEPRLGVMPGDPVCLITAYCWSFEDEEHLKAKCVEQKDAGDDTMGSYACVHIQATGIYDVKIFKFFDADTKCIIKSSPAGPQTDNEVLRKCAVTARDTIGPDQIKVAGP